MVYVGQQMEKKVKGCLFVQLILSYHASFPVRDQLVPNVENKNDFQSNHFCGFYEASFLRNMSCLPLGLSAIFLFDTVCSNELFLVI